MSLENNTFCKICNNVYLLSSHLKKHYISIKDYYDQYIKKENEGICYCGKDTKFSSLKNGYKKYCSTKCIANSLEVKEKRKQSLIRKYGVENPSQSQEIKNKKIQTNLNHYGVKNPSQSKEVHLKKIQTNLNRRGIEYPQQSKEIQKKTANTNIEKYGGISPLSSKIIKEKIRQTCLIKYNVENPSQSQEIKNKKIQTCQEHFGVDFPGQSKEVQDKIKKTNLDRTGIDNPFKDLKVQQQIKQTNIDRGNWISDNQYFDFELYHRLVNRYTSKSIRKKFTKEEITNKKIKGIHIDHRYSIQQGFINGILPYIIGSMNNLKILSSKENHQKHSKCSITKEELFQLYEQESKL